MVCEVHLVQVRDEIMDEFIIDCGLQLMFQSSAHNDLIAGHIVCRPKNRVIFLHEHTMSVINNILIDQFL